MVAIVTLITAEPGSAAQLTATPSTLASVFASAQGGDTIVLGGGDYGTWSGGSKPSMVTVTPAPGAAVTMRLEFWSGAGNIRIDGIKNLRGWDISGSRNIEIVNSTFTGTMHVRGSTSGIVFDNDTFHNLPTGTWEGRLSVAMGASGVTVRNSSFGNGGCSDGIQLTGGASNIRIEGNEFASMRQGACAAHVDPIQLYGASNVYVVSNWFHDNSTAIMSPDCNGSPITVRNNVFNMDEYPWAYTGGGTYDSTITHNVVTGGMINLSSGNCGTPSRDTIVRDNVAATSLQGTNIVADHNLLPGQVTFAGGSGRCAYRLAAGANGAGAASDGTDIGLNDCGVSGPPPPPPAAPPAPPPPPAAAPAGPTASFTSSPANPAVGDPVTFDASASTCAATPCTYEWEDDGPDGPGGGQWPLGTGKTMTFTFQGAGDKHVRLTMTDAQGRAATTVHTTTVAERVAPPSASYAYSPASPSTGQPVAFDARAATCAAAPCSYAWEDDGPDGPGGAQWPLGTGETMTFTFQEAGDKHVRLTVRDASGRQATAVRTVTVTAALALRTTASYTYSPADPVTGRPVFFDASQSTCAAPPCTYVWENDTDDGPGGYQRPLGSGEQISVTFYVPARKYVRLTVTDARGGWATIVKEIAVPAG